MKLLLSSAGMTNQTISEAFLKLVGKPASDIKVAFIPTAANVEEGNKASWLFLEYENLRRMGVAWVDMVDFSAAEVDWRTRLAECDVLYLTGGNTFYLLDQMRKTGFGEYLRQTLDSKVYVGTSASSIVMAPSIEVAAIPPSDPNLPGLTDLTGLNIIDFEIELHCDEARFQTVKNYAKARSHGIYALDDASAIVVQDGNVTVVSEGSWEYFENKEGK